MRENINQNITQIREKLEPIKEKLDPRNAQPSTIFTIANIISLSRAFLAIPIALLLGKDQYNAAVILMAVAVISDWLDGYAARKSNEVSSYGKALDPIADKLVAFAVLFVLIMKMDFPIWFIIIMGIRDFTITIMTTHLHNSRGIILGANKTGKLFIFIATVSAFMWIYPQTRELAHFVLYAATFVMLISWYFYIWDLSRKIKSSPKAPLINPIKKEL